MNGKHLLGLLLVLLIGCQSPSNDSVTLRWKLAEGDQLRYSVSISEIPTDPELAIHGFELLDNNELRERVKRRLASVSAATPSLEAQITLHGDLIQTAVIGITPHYDAPPADDDEAFERRIQESQSGNIELLGHFSKDGQLQDFFLRQKQRNLLNLFFSMPHHPVSTKTPWNLDVTLTEIGPGFYFQSANRVRNAYLEQLETINGERVARIFYVVSEDLKGNFKPRIDGDSMPIESTISHLAYGDFLIEEGKWAHFTMVAYTSGSGLSQNETMTIYALRP